MKLLYSPASPYSAKVRMAARHLGIEITEVKTDTNAMPPSLIDNNPLGKIPVLLRDDEAPIYDSIAIMHFLDRKSGGKLYPKKDEKRTEAEVLEALCDGVMDCLLAIVYERRSREEAKIHQPGSTSNGQRWCAASIIWKTTCRRPARSCMAAISRSPP